uniref:MADS-box domain-containing protein n=1 Tax=Solanum lycopersicum TaxID=4081 RepID=A0A3Q7GWZ4_SOLLC
MFASFTKRREGLYRKASELATEYNVDIGIMMISSTGKPHSFFHPTFDAVISRFQNPDMQFGESTNLEANAARNESKYARDLLQKAGLEKCISQPTPMAYLAITRLDIQFVVNRVAQRMHQPSEHDYHCLKRILRYIFGILGRGLLIRPGDLELRDFSDSDWANNKNDRKSTSGFLIFLGPNLISWCTKKIQGLSVLD